MSCSIINAGRGPGALGVNPGPRLLRSRLFWPLLLSLLFHFSALYSGLFAVAEPERGVADPGSRGAIALHFPQRGAAVKESHAFAVGVEPAAMASGGASSVRATRLETGTAIGKTSIAPIAAQSVFESDEFVTAHYFSRDFLDEPPVAMDEPDFEALPADMPSRLELVLLIEASGVVGRIVEPAGVSNDLSARLRRIFAPIRFIPGMLGGQAVPSRIRIELTQDETYVPVVVPVATGSSSVSSVGETLP